MILKLLRKIFASNRDEEVKELNEYLDKVDEKYNPDKNLKKLQERLAYHEVKSQDANKFLKKAANTRSKEIEASQKEAKKYFKFGEKTSNLESPEFKDRVAKSLKKSGITILNKGYDTNTFFPGADDINSPIGASVSCGPFASNLNHNNYKTVDEYYNSLRDAGVNDSGISYVKNRLGNPKTVDDLKVLGNYDNNTTSGQQSEHEKHHLRDYNENYNPKTKKMEKTPFNLNKDVLTKKGGDLDNTVSYEEFKPSERNKYYKTNGREGFRSSADKAIHEILEGHRDFKNVRENEENTVNSLGMRDVIANPHSNNKIISNSQKVANASNGSYSHTNKALHSDHLMNVLTDEKFAHKNPHRLNIFKAMYEASKLKK